MVESSVQVASQETLAGSDASRRRATREGGDRDGSPACGLDAQELRRRWDLVLPHREVLLAMARRRVYSREDAEDVVSTAMERTVVSANLDTVRVGPYLCTTVIRLCVDVHRQRARQLQAGQRAASRELPLAPIDEAICDSSEALWLSALLASAPIREQQVLAARMEGVAAGDVAGHLGLTRKSAENAYSRLRGRAVKALAAAMGLLGVLVQTIRHAAPPTVTVALPVVLVSLAWALHASRPVGDAPPARPLPTFPASAAGDADAGVGPLRPQQIADPTKPGPAVGISGAGRDVPDRSASAPRSSAPERIEVKAPPLAPELANGIGVTVQDQKQYEDETFIDSAQRCIDRVTLEEPLADPCR